MAFDEHLVDFVNRLPAVSGRMARPERRLEFRTWRLLPFEEWEKVPDRADEGPVRDPN